MSLGIVNYKGYFFPLSMIVQSLDRDAEELLLEGDLAQSSEQREIADKIRALLENGSEDKESQLDRIFYEEVIWKIWRMDKDDFCRHGDSGVRNTFGVTRLGVTVTGASMHRNDFYLHLCAIEQNNWQLAECFDKEYSDITLNTIALRLNLMTLNEFEQGMVTLIPSQMSVVA